MQLFLGCAILDILLHTCDVISVILEGFFAAKDVVRKLFLTIVSLSSIFLILKLSHTIHLLLFAHSVQLCVHLFHSDVFSSHLFGQIGETAIETVHHQSCLLVVGLGVNFFRQF